jgi:3-oxoacyl-[acyl-carrier-protein] synthase II
VRRRVVVTGMGIVCPIGMGTEEVVDALVAGRSGIGPITVFDASSLPTRIAGEVRGATAGVAMGPLRDRKIAFALEAARQAWTEATACGSRPVEGDACVSMGVGLELFSMDDLARSRAPDFSPPAHMLDRLAFMQTPSDVCVHAIAHRYGLRAPPLVHVSACAAGTDAIGAAFRLIASGRRRWALAGGTDSMINPLGVAGFCALGATSTRNDEPARASRPFDRARDGFVMGEGAGALVLEALEDVERRGAPILAEIAGYGCSFDAHGISEPHPEGRGALQAMQRALRDAGIGPGDVDAVNAHATGTPKNDAVETLALRRLFGDRARDVPICATKSMIGHLISAAGAVEAVCAILCMRRGIVHPTINLEEPDPACDLDYVPGAARPHAQRWVLSSSFGFGGQNAAIVLGDGGRGRARG